MQTVGSLRFNQNQQFFDSEFFHRTGVFCSNQLGNSRQMDLSGPGIDVKLKERKKERKNQQFFESRTFKEPELTVL